MQWTRSGGLILAAMIWAAAPSARAQTLEAALAKAYENNPQINAQRAFLRATNENVPQALSGYRPLVSATASYGAQYIDSKNTTTNAGQPLTTEQHGWNDPRSVGGTLTQNLFNGFQTANRTRQAESQVFAARETLRVIEQTVLLDATTAYMNVLRDSATLDLQKRNVEVIQEQLRQTRDRFNVGEVTRTDVAQAESRVAAAQSQVLAAESNLAGSKAAFRRIIGIEAGRLTPGTPVDRLSPNKLDVAVSRGQSENPAVTAAEYGVDVAALQVKVNEGALYPTVNMQASVQQNYDTSLSTSRAFTGGVFGLVSVPIYQGGQEFSKIRQSKETVGQRRLELALNRDQARANVVQAWAQLEAAKAQIEATRAQVAAAEIALNGVREEARVGQRTTLDVLNAQQELVNSRVSLVTAQRDRVVASYTLLSATGRLTAATLGLKVPLYDPMVHYQQVRDSWIGMRTPEGR